MVLYVCLHSVTSKISLHTLNVPNLNFNRYQFNNTDFSKILTIFFLCKLYIYIYFYIILNLLVLKILFQKFNRVRLLHYNESYTSIFQLKIQILKFKYVSSFKLESYNGVMKFII